MNCVSLQFYFSLEIVVKRSTRNARNYESETHFVFTIIFVSVSSVETFFFILYACGQKFVATFFVLFFFFFAEFLM